MQNRATLSVPSRLESLVDQLLTLQEADLQVVLQRTGYSPFGQDEILRARASANKLTKRELEVLQYVLAGQASKTIADVLKISNKTVDMYRTRAQVKFMARNTAQLCALATVAGIHPTTP